MAEERKERGQSAKGVAFILVQDNSAFLVVWNDF